MFLRVTSVKGTVYPDYHLITLYNKQGVITINEFTSKLQAVLYARCVANILECATYYGYEGFEKI
jgi:hypothetical protein